MTAKTMTHFLMNVSGRGIVCLLLLAPLLSFAQSKTPNITLENKLYRVNVDPENGVIRQILDKNSGIELIAEQRLADNFRLLIPMPDLEGNYIHGSEQKLSSHEEATDSLTLRWDSPLTNSQGKFDAGASMRITLLQQAIEFKLTVENHTKYAVGEVWYPILGGITGIGERADTEEMIPYRGWSTDTRLFQEFTPMSGLGIPEAEAYWTYPFPMTMTWMDLFNRKKNRAVYFAIHDEVSRYKALRFELHPGIANRKNGNWPPPEEATHQPTGLLTHWALFPYIHPGETFEGPPCVLQFHDGDWHTAAKFYRDWFESKFQMADRKRNWMYEELAFQDTMFLLPEGNVTWTFKDISRWAGDALAYGVKSVLISGWNVGGHDAGYPDYTPDPRLGTWDDLAAGIRACHNMGIKVFFFVNVQPVDCETDWYRQIGYRYRAIGPWGGAVTPGGWGMGSLGARIGITRRPLVSASSGIPEYRKLIVDQMEKLARIGADGIHIDKLCPAGMNFNPLLKMTPDRAVSEGQLAAVREIQQACAPINSNFAISAECPWDRLLEFTGVGWAWHPVMREHTPAFKFTFQEYLPTMAATQPFDYTAVNNALRYGYQIFLGPGNYTKSMAYGPFQALSKYVKEVIRIRNELKETIYQGEFLDSLEANVRLGTDTGNGVFKNPTTGKRACVIVNYAQVPREVSFLGFDGNTSGPVKVYEPFKPAKTAKLPITAEVPAERFVITMEQ